MAAPPLDITAIGHVQIAVPRAQEAEALHFYRAVLGLREIPKPPELRGRGGAWFQVGALQMHVGVDEHESPKSKRHVCFLVPDVKRAHDALVNSGVTIEEESFAEGRSRFFIRDPAGNRIEIGQR